MFTCTHKDATSMSNIRLQPADNALKRKGREEGWDGGVRDRWRKEEPEAAGQSRDNSRERSTHLGSQVGNFSSYVFLKVFFFIWTGLISCFALLSAALKSE